MQTMCDDPMTLNDPITSLDAEIVRLAGVIAKALADRIKASLKEELAGVVPEVVAAEPQPKLDTSPAAEASVETEPAIANPEGTSAPTGISPIPDLEDNRASWRAELDSLEGFSEDVRDDIGTLGEVYELACKAVDAGIRADEIEGYLSQASVLAGEQLAPDDAACRLALFRSAVSFETRERKREDKERRAAEAASRKLAKMAQKREKVAAQQAKRRRELEGLLSKANTPALPVAPVVVEIKPIADALRKAVVVVGLLPSQVDMIKREFGEAFEFAFYDNEHLGRMTNILPHADGVVLMTDFISHSHSDLFDGLGKLIRVTGGMTSLRKALRDYYQESYLSAKEA